MQTTRVAGGGGRRPTGAQLQRFPSLHRASFLVALQDQLLSQLASEQERERLREVESIHAILHKPPEARDGQDIDMLYDWVLKNGSTNKIFQGAQEIICKTICREMTLLELSPKGVVCYQGDFGDTFYIIITGSVSLFIDPKAKLRAIQEEMTGTPERSDRYFRELQQQHSKGGTVTDADDANQQRMKHFGSFIKQIKAGGTFGELAVLDPTARRSCTVVCDVPTSFICLKRGAYQRLIRITNSTQLDFTPAELLETLFFFDGWPHGELTRLSNRLRHLSFSAGTFLTRVGSEANVVYFIYSGIVQETRPMLQYLNDNGTVYKCTAVNTKDPRKQSASNDLRAKDKTMVRKVALELNLYQDHDICGEYPVFFERPFCTTDLLAVTDVKTLIMDRETWKELFFMHGLEHILESYNKFLKLAQARENWRKIRMKLALANPGITLTLSTKEMMLDGKCMCGWCGSTDHITGDLACPSLIACRKKEADREKKPRPVRPKKMFEMGVRALAVKNTVNFVNTLVESVGAAPSEPSTQPATISNEGHDQTPSKLRSSPAHPPLTAPPTNAAARRISLKLVARQIVSDKPDTGPQLAPHPPAMSSTIAGNQEKSDGTLVASPHQEAVMRKDAVSDLPALCKASQQLYAMHQQALELGEASAIPEAKAEDIRKGAFTECLEAQYKQEMLKKVKRVSNMKDYYGARTSVLDSVAQDPVRPPEERYCSHKQPRKPKIPKPNRRLVSSKTGQPRPDRFNRKINRMLKKLWVKDHPLPVVEESLRDA